VPAEPPPAEAIPAASPGPAEKVPPEAPAVEVAADAPGAAPAVEAASPAAGGAADASVIPAEPGKVRVVLEGVPAGAVIRADGREMPGPAFELDRGEGEFRLEVSAAGHVAWRRSVPADRDATVAVRMRRAETGTSGGATPADAGASGGAADVGGARVRPGGVPTFGEGP
jgi:hypothetical protein